MLSDEMRFALGRMFTAARRRDASGAVTPTGPGASPRGAGAQTPGGAGAPGDGGALAGDGASPLVVTCLPQKRAFTVEVAMRRVNLAPEELARRIDCLDAGALPAEDVAAVASMLPTRDEVEAVRRARARAEAAAGGASTPTPGRGAPGAPLSAQQPQQQMPSQTPQTPTPLRLGPVEALFDALGRVPRLEAKMRALAFRHEAAAAAAAARDYSEALRRALAAATRSGRVRALLLAVRDVANVMNAHRAGGRVQGFRLASLRRLRDTR